MYRKRTFLKTPDKFIKVSNSFLNQENEEEYEHENADIIFIVQIRRIGQKSIERIIDHGVE